MLKKVHPNSRGSVAIDEPHLDVDITCHPRKLFRSAIRIGLIVVLMGLTIDLYSWRGLEPMAGQFTGRKPGERSLAHKHW